MEIYNNIIMALEKWNTCGERILDNGTKIICHVPHVAPQAWLHEIYNPLNSNDVEKLQDRLGKQLQEDYRQFLLLSNGINIFSDSLSVWGLKKSYDRRGEEAIQPYDLIAGNEEIRGVVPNSYVLFGSYSWDGSTMAYDISSNSCKVFLCAPDTYEILKEWENIWVWLNEEVNRLSLMFDEKGVMYDEDVPTIPTN